MAAQGDCIATARDQAVIGRLDDFLIDRVFQPMVLALGVEVQVLVRAGLRALVAITFGQISLAWIADGNVNWPGLLCLAVITSIANSHLRRIRSSVVFMTLRLVWVAAVTADLSGFILARNLPWLLALAYGVTFLWVEYVSVCRDPPPRAAFAWVGAR